MNASNGPTRMMLVNCGKYTFADVDLTAPLHLVGPNNVGKTSLIALLQFLYLDDQRHMHFTRSMSETRNYYFPDPYSYVLFELMTPTGFQVLGVHGLGPLRQYQFERFSYTGRLDRADYVDDTGTVRSLSANDLSAGRSPAEVLRTVQALRSGGLCSADWNQGDAFVG